MTATTTPLKLADPAAVDDEIDNQADEPTEITAEPADPPALTPTQQVEHDHYEEIKKLTQDVYEARREWASAKDQASALKKGFEALSTELIDTIRRGPEMQRKLPLAGEASESATVAHSDAWRDVEVGELDIPDSLVGKLCEHGLHTLGELSDFWKSRRDLTELKGIGGAKELLVTDAFAKYGQEHPEVFGQAEEEPCASAENIADEANVADADAEGGGDIEDLEDGEDWGDLDE